MHSVAAGHLLASIILRHINRNKYSNYVLFFTLIFPDGSNGKNIFAEKKETAFAISFFKRVSMHPITMEMAGIEPASECVSQAPLQV